MAFNRARARAVVAVLVVYVGALAAQVAVGAASSPRIVTCDGAKKDIPAAGMRAYQTFFRSFNSSTVATVNAEELNFEALDGLATAMSGGVDVGEFLVGVNQIQAAWDGTVASAKSLWNATWHERAAATAARAAAYKAAGQTIHATHTLFKASSYYQLAERFQDHLSTGALATYKLSLDAYEEAVAMDPTTEHWCELSPVPYTDSTGSYHLHAYMCRPGGRGTTNTHPTVLAMGGYDSSAELTMSEVGALALSYGYNVLAFDGPGQGATVRFEGLHFRPDWNVVVDQILDYVTKLPGVNETSIALWGRSFGGFLTPRACANEPRLRACVADGGVLDFYQALLCDLGPVVMDIYFNDTDKFNTVMNEAATMYLGVGFLLDFGKLGFGTTSPADLFNTMSAYTNAGQLGGLTGRPIFVNNPPFDTLVGNQSEIFYAALPRPLSPATVLHSDDAQFGTALHCSVGSSDTTYDILDWLQKVM